MSSMLERIDTPDDATHRRSGAPRTARPAALPDSLLATKALRFGPRRVVAGGDVVSEGGASPACFVVKQGWVAPYKLLRDGRRQLLDLLMDGDGIRICRDDRGRAFHSVLALTHALVLEGPVEELARLGAIHCGDDPCAAPIFTEQQRRMMERMAILGHGRAAERLAACLLDIWKRQQARGNVDESGSCPIPIRQSDLGDAVGLTAVHVCRTLTMFRKLGLLEFANGRLTMPRPGKLAFIAGLDAERG